MSQFGGKGRKCITFHLNFTLTAKRWAELVKKALVAAVKQKMCFPAAGKGGRIPVKMEILDRNNFGVVKGVGICCLQY